MNTQTEVGTGGGADRNKGFLGFVERVGNLLPDPVMIFVWLIGFLMVLSAIGAALGWTASLPFAGETPPAGAVLKDGIGTFTAESLFSEANISKLVVEAPRTFTGFAPLGLVLLVMLGAAVAERAGLFSAMVRNSLTGVPRAIMTPLVALIGVATHYASDVGYVIFIPLCGLIYAAAGRHPLVGIAAAFAAVAGGFAGNFTPGSLDVLLFGFTQEAARIVDPTWTMNPLGNWWFILSIVFLYTPIIWFITDRVLEPRMGPWGGQPDVDLQAELQKAAVTADEKRGLRRALVAALVVAAGFAALALWPGYTPLIDETKEGPARLVPFYQSFILAFTLMFLSTGIAFGTATGAIKSDKDVVAMMTEGLRTLAPYVVFAFFAAHFVAMFNWSKLGPIFAINGAETLKALELPASGLLVSVLGFSAFLDLFIGSASAKWSALAPVVVPMFMLVGISPEMTTAAYRMGDSFTNIMTPLMSHFPLILVFCRRWDKSVGVGTVLAMMLPYALAFMASGIVLVAAWVHFDWPLGPGATVHYAPPGAPAP
jgi:aminobenzoyl-glutamate transport protein